MTEIIAPQTEVILVESQDEIVAIVPQPQAVIIEVRRGPAGPPGATGQAGADGHDGSGVFPDGTNTGDIIRWNAATGLALAARLGEMCFQVDELAPYVCTVIA